MKMDSLIASLQRFAACAALWLKLGKARARHGNRLAYLVLATCSTVLCACGFLPQPHTVPMPTLQDRQSSATRAKRLIVMLPGIYDKASEFVSEGFVADLRERGIDADVLMPEAHYGYYEARDVDVRLEEDVFAPARTQGYKEIWIVGVSLGGLGSLLYSAEHPETVKGILLIAPFPGQTQCSPKSRKQAVRSPGRAHRRHRAAMSAMRCAGSLPYTIRPRAVHRRYSWALANPTGFSRGNRCWLNSCRPRTSASWKVGTTGQLGARSGVTSWTTVRGLWKPLNKRILIESDFKQISF